MGAGCAAAVDGDWVVAGAAQVRAPAAGPRVELPGHAPRAALLQASEAHPRVCIDLPFSEAVG